jgi:hypothetical protein
MYVITGLRADFGKQCAVHPVYDRSIHFTRPTKHPAVIPKLSHEDVLHLQVTAGMKQRNGIQETLDGAGTQMEALILDAFANKMLE